MANDIIKTYSGNLILPFGTPYIITTAWETETQYHTQSIAYLDCLDRTAGLYVSYQSFPKSAPDGYLPASLSKNEALDYCLAWGYRTAYKNIPKLLWDYGYKRLNHNVNLPNPNTIEVVLKEMENMELVVLHHLLKIDLSIFAWLENEAKSNIFKSLLKTTRDLKIEESEYPGKTEV